MRVISTVYLHDYAGWDCLSLVARVSAERSGDARSEYSEAVVLSVSFVWVTRCAVPLAPARTSKPCQKADQHQQHNRLSI